MFSVEMLPAQQGDALWIEYGVPHETHRVLIDCGTPPTYEVIRRRIERLAPNDRSFDLLIVTHIDTDHIGGALKLLADRSLGVRFEDVWFNDWDHLPQCPDPARGPIDGAIMSRILEGMSLVPNRQLVRGVAVIPDGGPLPTVTLSGGMVLTLLSPGTAQLAELHCTWERVLRKAGLDPAGPSTDELARRARRKGVEVYRGPGVSDVDALAVTRFVRDRAPANGSTIAVLAEYEGRSCLLTGDAFPDVVTASLAHLGRDRGVDSIAVDAVKLPHHGSRRNVSVDLLRSLTCRTYLLSTDGSVFGHPDPEAVARVIRYGGPAPRLIFNYRSAQNRIWDDPRLMARYRYQVRYPSEGQPGLRLDLDDLPVAENAG